MWQASASHQVQYAGFWRRWVGAYIDSWIISILIAVATLVTAMLLFVGVSLVPSGRGAWVMAATSAVIAFGGSFAAWYHIIPRRMSVYGATPGMRLAQVEIVDSSHMMHIGRWRAVWRGVAAYVMGIGSWIITLPIQVAVLSRLLDLPVARSDQAFPGTISLGGSFAFIVASNVASTLGGSIPQLLNLTNRRRRTLYDFAAGTVVINRS